MKCRHCCFGYFGEDDAHFDEFWMFKLLMNFYSYIFRSSIKSVEGKWLLLLLLLHLINRSSSSAHVDDVTALLSSRFDHHRRATSTTTTSSSSTSTSEDDGVSTFAAGFNVGQLQKQKCCGTAEQNAELVHGKTGACVV